MTSRLQPPSDLNPRPDPALDFPDKNYGEMTPADYDAIGFMSGLEVHQQLKTRSKLFCRCPGGHFVDRHDAEVLRHMRPTLSELGEYDGTALMEFKTRKEIVYLLDRENVCTYEIDDTPPFEIDPEAVDISLEIAMLFELGLVDELHVMRKQYLDGSIPTGFQRTAMIGTGGVVPFQVPELGIDRSLSIRQLSLEEDSCREVSDVGHRIVFRTDRLGMPLTEVVTEPELMTPEELQAGARFVARVTRCCPRVRRGAGAARQDVNVSVAGGRRVEIKGVPQHKGLPLLVHNEAFRQLNLLRIRERLRERGLKAEDFDSGVHRTVWDSSLVLDVTSRLSSAFGEDSERAVAAIRLPGLGDLLSHPTQPGVPFKTELDERLRVIACLLERPLSLAGAVNGKTLSIEGVQATHSRELVEALKAESGDGVMLISGPRFDVETGAQEILIRAAEATVGVPPETRQSLHDGTTGFERVLPGADRMYPDTDTPPLPITADRRERIRSQVRTRPWEIEKALVSRGFEEELARSASQSSVSDLLMELRWDPPLSKPLFFALKKLGRRISRVDVAGVQALLDGVGQRNLRTEAFEEAVQLLAQEPHKDPQHILERYKDTETSPASVAALCGEYDKPRTKITESRVEYYMGRLRSEFLGRLDPTEVKTELSRRVEAEQGASHE